VRGLVSLTLIGLIALCPAFCGAEEVGHGPHHHGVSGAAASDPAAPTHCSEDGDNCICQGAVPAVDVRVSPPVHDLGLPLLFAAIIHTPPHPLAHLTPDVSPTGLGAWGDALAIRAMLQNFRC